MHFAPPTFAALLGSLSIALAQTSTDCNPTLKSCPADTGLNAATVSADFTKGKPASFSEASGTSLTYGSSGAEFKISQYGQAPTIQSDFYFLFGRVDVVMQAAPGTGVISSIVLESDDLDEIDYEWLGGDAAQVQSNYFGKGNTTTYDRAQFHAVSSPQTTMHTYSIDWNSDRCIYSIDGTVVRTLRYQDSNGGANYPQTPMRLKLGNWTPPKDAPGTIQWAGGPVDWSAGPFSMIVKSVSIQNYNPAGSYEYSDRSGSWQSIKIVNGSSSSSPGGGSSGGSPDTANGSSSASTTASAVGSGMTVSGSVTATSAPTSSHSVANIQQTQVAVNTTSVSPTSSSAAGAGAGAEATPTTFSSVAVPITTGSSGSGYGSDSGSGYGSSGNGTAAFPSKGPASPPTQQTNTGSSLQTTAAWFLMMVVAGVFMV